MATDPFEETPPLPAEQAFRAATPTRRLVAALMISTSGVYLGLITPLQLVLALHLSVIAGRDAAAAFGIVTGFGALAALVANPLSGQLSDRTINSFGRRRTWILSGSLAGAVCLLAMSITTQVWEVALAWCLIQAAFNFQLAATSALVADQVSPDRRGSVSGLLGLATAAGPIIGLSAASLLTGPATQWIVLAAITAAAGVFAVSLLKDPQYRPGDGRPRLGIIGVAKSFWLNPIRHPAFGWAWITRFLIASTFAGGSYNAFLLIDRFHMSTASVAPVILALSLLSIVFLAGGSVIAGRLSDRLRRQKPFVIAGGVLASTGLLLLAVSSSLPLVFVATALLGVGTGIFAAVDVALCIRILPNPANIAKDFAILNIANTIPQSIVPFAAPALIALGGFPALYLVLAVLGVLGAVASLRLPEIGQENDPRFSPITRMRSTPA